MAENDEKKILHVVRRNEQVFGWIFMCPGCHGVHIFMADGRWHFNGNAEKPTFTGSLRTHIGENKDCHLTMTDGKIQFQNDCWHEMKGKTLDMEPF